MSAGDRTAYRGSRASAEQAAANRALRGVVGVRATGQRQNQTRGNAGEGNRSLCHFIPFHKSPSRKSMGRSADKPSILSAVQRAYPIYGAGAPT